jgi:uncharacterized protein YjbI with pentapeptide repeats
MDTIILILIIAILFAMGLRLFLHPVWQEVTLRNFREKLIEQGHRRSQDLGAELLSAAFTTLLLTLLLSSIQSCQANAALKRSLIARMGSANNAVADAAVRELDTNGWLVDGSLIGEAFGNANLQNSRLSRANLRAASFSEANLSDTIFTGANLVSIRIMSSDLQRANFDHAIMERAEIKSSDLRQAFLNNSDLTEADLDSSDMRYSILRDANMRGANLHRVDLRYANLEAVDFTEANLWGVQFSPHHIMINENTILPDGNHWTNITDLSRFTSPAHPYFWRSTNPASPAFQPT